MDFTTKGDFVWIERTSIDAVTVIGLCTFIGFLPIHFCLIFKYLS